MSEPFAPTEAPEHPRARTGRAPARAIVAFVLRRLLALFVLPVLVGAVFRLADVTGDQTTPLWALFAGAAVSGLVFLPTTLVYVWGRFLAPRDDPKALLLGTGERIDRPVYTRLAYAGIAERLVGTVLLLALAAGMGRYGLLALVTTPLLLLGAAYNAYLVYVAWHAAHALIAHAGHDPEGALRHTAPLERAWIGARGRDAMRVLRATAELRSGRPDDALATLARVTHAKATFADLLQAQILAGRGDLGPAKEAAKRTPANVGERLGIESCAALVALAERDAQAILDRAPAWHAFGNELPADVAGSFDLWLAAAHVLRGDLAQAHAAYVTSGVSLDDRAWMRATWPDLWALLVRAAAPLSAG